MTPFIIDDSKERYQERVDATEQWRLAKAVQTRVPSILDQLRATLGDRLIAWGTRVKAHATTAGAGR